ncbi:MAG: bacteriochlorophyll 4-vinyl reductase [Acetobacteraceae bacterium]
MARSAHALGLVGPNAITRFAEALRERCGDETTSRVFAEAGLADRLASPPETMVAEGEVLALHRAARALLARGDYEWVARDAGERTARYILANRLPGAVRLLLRRLPPALAAPLLARAIARHAWTFAGSGRFRVERGPPLAFVLADGPLGGGLRSDSPACGYFVATFEGLFRALVHPEAEVVERACQAMGAPACVFTVAWPRGLTRTRPADRDATWRGRAPAAPPQAR